MLSTDPGIVNTVGAPETFPGFTATMAARSPHVLLHVSPAVLQDALGQILEDTYDLVTDASPDEHFDVAIVSVRPLPKRMTADVTVLLPPDGAPPTVRISAGATSEDHVVRRPEELIAVIERFRQIRHQPPT